MSDSPDPNAPPKAEVTPEMWRKLRRLKWHYIFISVCYALAILISIIQWIQYQRRFWTLVFRS